MISRVRSSVSGASRWARRRYVCSTRFAVVSMVERRGSGALWGTAAAVQLRSLSSATANPSGNGDGKGNERRSLYDLSVPLREATDFVELTEQAIARINAIRESLKADHLRRQSRETSSSPTLLSTREQIALLDSISNELCSVMDAAEMCRNSHADGAFRQSAEDSFTIFASFTVELNADDFLYREILLPIIHSPELWASLSPEEQFFVLDMKRDFESEGIHLKAQKLLEMKEQQNETIQSETIWSQNLVNPKAIQTMISIGPFPTQSDANFASLRKWLNQYIPQSDDDSHRRVRSLTCSLDRRLLSPLIGAMECESLRASLYFENLLQPFQNVTALRRLMRQRQQLAETLGFESHAHRAMQKHVCKTPEAALELLQSLGDAIRPQGEKELQRLRAWKESIHSQELHRQQAESSGLLHRLFVPKDEEAKSSLMNSSILRPWDEDYLMSIEKQDRQRRQAENKSIYSLSQYFPLDACVDGLQLVSQQLFGIKMREVAVAENGEDWIASSTDLSGKLLRRFDVFDEKDVFQGSCYFDLYDRENKFPGSAHFTIRCGCEAIDWQQRTPVHIVSPLKTYRQTPIVALVFHFQRPRHKQQHQGIDSNGLFHSSVPQPLLSLRDVETLFHEWGHALHSLLSATKFQHLSGTRGATDFMEIPSHLMEFFARDPGVIRKWARHHVTGEPIPEGLLEQAFEHKSDFTAMEVQHQLLLSGADQLLFGSKMRDVALDYHISDANFLVKVMDGVARVQTELTSLPLASTDSLLSLAEDYDQATGTGAMKRHLCKSLPALPTMSIFNHGHFVNYGGTYYSYLFAKMCSSQIWHQNLAGDPLNSDVGKFIHKNLFAVGCSRAPKEVLNVLCRGPLDPNYYLKQIL